LFAATFTSASRLEAACPAVIFCLASATDFDAAFVLSVVCFRSLFLPAVAALSNEAEAAVSSLVAKDSVSVLLSSATWVLNVSTSFVLSSTSAINWALFTLLFASLIDLLAATNIPSFIEVLAVSIWVWAVLKAVWASGFWVFLARSFLLVVTSAKDFLIAGMRALDASMAFSEDSIDWFEAA